MSSDQFRQAAPAMGLSNSDCANHGKHLGHKKAQGGSSSVSSNNLAHKKPPDIHISAFDESGILKAKFLSNKSFAWRLFNSHLNCLWLRTSCWGLVSHPSNRSFSPTGFPVLSFGQEVMVYISWYIRVQAWTGWKLCTVLSTSSAEPHWNRLGLYYILFFSNLKWYCSIHPNIWCQVATRAPDKCEKLSDVKVVT